MTSYPMFSFFREDSLTVLSFSQPEPGVGFASADYVGSNDIALNNVCFSQPARPENMFLSSQTQTTQSSSQVSEFMQRDYICLFVRLTSLIVLDTLATISEAYDALFCDYKCRVYDD